LYVMFAPWVRRLFPYFGLSVVQQLREKIKQFLIMSL
jgi:hypothetical protein